MKLKSFAAGLAAAALVTTPVLAQADLDAPQRTASEVEGKEDLQGSGLVIALLAAAAVITAIIIATDDDDEDVPTSP